MVQPKRHVRIFRHGRNQALRIPRGFVLEGDEAIIRKEGNQLIVESIGKGRLLDLLTALEPLARISHQADRLIKFIFAHSRRCVEFKNSD